MTALLSAIIRSTKMKIRSSKKATSNSPEYKRGVIILGQRSARSLKGLARKQTKKESRERKAKEKNSESRTTG